MGGVGGGEGMQRISSKEVEEILEKCEASHLKRVGVCEALGEESCSVWLRLVQHWMHIGSRNHRRAGIRIHLSTYF